MDYAALVADRRAYRQYLDEQIEQHPELFPVDIQQGYRFHGLVRSLRQQLETRRIYLFRSHAVKNTHVGSNSGFIWR